MKKSPKTSESEWRVMKSLWANNPATANEVVEALSKTTRWKPKTIRTLLNRLVAKKALGYKEMGRQYHYYPIVAETECVRAESRSFLRRVYGGALRHILAAFLESEDLSPGDIKYLKRILEEKERQ